MNHFNAIFALVKEECAKHTSVKGLDGFRNMAAKTGLPLERLHFYLECLEQVGVIIYDQEKRIVTLTDKGLTAERIFP